jgi:hypothetical protein
MEFLLALALFFTINADRSSFQTTAPAAQVHTIEAEEFFGTIVLDDIIARANSGSSTDPVTTFKVYYEPTMTLVLSLWSCNDCPHNLSHLDPGTYLLEAVTQSNATFQETVVLD